MRNVGAGCGHPAFISVIASQCSHWRGERSERCLWQMKRGERVAAVKILGA